MNPPSRPAYQAVVQAAIDATGADRGWLMRAESDHLVVVAAGGGGDAHTRVAARRPRLGIAAYVIASGQPAAIQTRPGDTDNLGAGGAAGAPRSVLAAPCGNTGGGVLGVLEVVDAVGGSFTFDDVETIVLLADIAGAALSEQGVIEAPPAPEQLAAALTTLALDDPVRYAALARVVEALL